MDGVAKSNEPIETASLRVTVGTSLGLGNIDELSVIRVTTAAHCEGSHRGQRVYTAGARPMMTRTTLLLAFTPLLLASACSKSNPPPPSGAATSTLAAPDDHAP